MDNALPPSASSDPSFDDIPFRGIVEQSLAGMYVIQDEVYQYVNATFAGMLGYTVEEMTGMALRDSVVPHLQDEVVYNFHRRVDGEVPSIRYFTQGQHKDGHPVFMEVHGSRLLFRGRPAVVGVGVNITEQVRQQEEIRVSRERLQELAAYINRVREEQRARIARELHDVVGGMLTSIKMDIHRIQRRVDAPEVQHIVRDLLDLVQDSIAVVRGISEDLRPGALDQLGLVEALEAELRVFSERTEIVARLTVDRSPAPMPQEKATAIYRICQEALTNVARHAGASQVEVRLRHADGDLLLEIEDNGKGMVSLSPSGKSIGLVSMAERAREFGGMLGSCEGALGGTCLRVRLPLDHLAHAVGLAKAARATEQGEA